NLVPDVEICYDTLCSKDRAYFNIWKVCITGFDLTAFKHFVRSLETINITSKREKFTKEEIILTKRIAKARIHVERFNERLKKFRLIDRIIPLSLAHMASQLVFVGCMLVNFQEFLCK
uniref:DDE Tnp4 domain-containing protein n=1 Tax=Clytia hemisphaerica TaxID=252671 RepID=A0A7M5UW80_9CNID